MVEEDIYLVLVAVSLIGGGNTVAVDAIQAESAVEAKNIAVNFFLLRTEEEENVAASVMFGDVLFLPGTIAAVEASVLGVLDRTHRENRRWIEAVEMSEEMMKQWGSGEPE